MKLKNRYYGSLGKIFGYPEGLPNGFPLKISYKGRTIEATKGDVIFTYNYYLILDSLYYLKKKTKGWRRWSF